METGIVLKRTFKRALIKPAVNQKLLGRNRKEKCNGDEDRKDQNAGFAVGEAALGPDAQQTNDTINNSKLHQHELHNNVQTDIVIDNVKEIKQHNDEQTFVTSPNAEILDSGSTLFDDQKDHNEISSINNVVKINIQSQTIINDGNKTGLKKWRSFVKPSVNQRLFGYSKPKVDKKITPSSPLETNPHQDVSDSVIIPKSDSDTCKIIKTDSHKNPELNTENQIQDTLKAKTENTNTSEAESFNKLSTDEHMSYTKPKINTFTRRPFIKPSLNKKVLTKTRKDEKINSTDQSNTLPIPHDVNLDSQSDSELEVVTISKQEISEHDKTNGFLKPFLNTKQTKSKRDEQVTNSDTSELLNYMKKDDLSHSDSEHTSAKLASPVKMIGRNRIKAVPRLGQRRISTSFYGSASESEDDIRKNYKRIRTESASSACGTQEVCNSESEGTEKGKDTKLFIPRKCRRSEQSRKIAEARRNFVHKFGKGVPDKQKLTMMDLIFYNPATQPMSQQPIKQPRNATPSNDKIAPLTNKENEVIPVEEDDAIPAPQIKIGLNGEIVIDEKSLIIENVQTRKSREELQKSALVDGDFDTGYGIFKRVKRTKEWSNTETVYFYKALNTLGTDFTLMSQFFHNRSRRELKIKFKKEEKLNSALIDKALRDPALFDINDLGNDFEKQKKLMEPDSEVDVIIQRTTKYLNQSNRRGNKKKRIRVKQKKKKTLYSRLKKGISSLWETTSEEEDEKKCGILDCENKITAKNEMIDKYECELDDDHNDDHNDDDGHNAEETLEVDTILKPTRSGRIPKRTQEFGTYDYLVKRRRAKRKPNKVNPMLPGSVVIVSFPSETGVPSYQVFMVTDNQTKIPITLSKEVLNNLTQSSIPVETPTFSPFDDENENSTKEFADNNPEVDCIS